MELNELLYPEMKDISDSICYKKSIGAKDLYDKLADLNCPMDDKVKFALQHWGWKNTIRKESEAVIKDARKSGFNIPATIITVYHQFWGLHIPVRNVFRQGGENFIDYGGTVIFDFDGFSWKDMIPNAEMLGVKFRETVLPFGIRHNYNGYSSNLENCWENPNYSAYGWGVDELYIGSGGKIYAIVDVEYGGLIEIEAINILDFFAVSFGFTSACTEEIGEIDIETPVIEEIEDLIEKGIYTQNCLWDNSRD